MDVFYHVLKLKKSFHVFEVYEIFFDIFRNLYCCRRAVVASAGAAEVGVFSRTWNAERRRLLVRADRGRPARPAVRRTVGVDPAHASRSDPSATAGPH